MKLSTLQLAGVILLSLAMTATSGLAQESFSDSDIDSESVGRAGLLGRGYVEGQFIYIDAPEEIEQLDDSLTGFRASANVPMPWINEFQTMIFQDAFISTRRLGISGTLPELGTGGEFASSTADWAIGTTLFADVTPVFRPFVQMGYQKTIDKVRMHGFGNTFKEKDVTDEFMLNFGAEYDFTDSTAVRVTIFSELEDQFDESFYTAELIHWLHPHIFLRGGLVGDLRNEIIGTVVGGGFAF